MFKHYITKIKIILTHFINITFNNINFNVYKQCIIASNNVKFNLLFEIYK